MRLRGTCGNTFTFIFTSTIATAVHHTLLFQQPDLIHDYLEAILTKFSVKVSLPITFKKCLNIMILCFMGKGHLKKIQALVFVNAAV